MYSREELASHFGPYQVQIADYNLCLKDGTLISTRFWFPGPKLPAFPANWDIYCQASNKGNESLEVRKKGAFFWSFTNEISFRCFEARL